MKNQFKKFEKKCGDICHWSTLNDKGEESSFRIIVMFVFVLLATPFIIVYDILKFILCFIRLSDPTKQQEINAPEEAENGNS